MRAEARIVHSLPGRLRIKFDRLRGAEELLAVADKMQGCPGIRSVTANPLTGSLLILHDTCEAEIVHYAEAQSLFSVRPLGEAPARSDAAAGLRALSQGVRLVTGDAVDLDGLLVLLLTGLAIQQAIEGNLMAPAATLLWYAYTLSRMPPLDASAPQPAAAGEVRTASAVPHKARARPSGAAKTRQNARKHRATAAR